MSELQILILPEPETLDLESFADPMLIYMDRHPEYGAGWMLLRADAAGKLQPSHIPGGIDDVEQAVEQARELLRNAGGGSE